jgi:hypothetical protein
MLSAYESVGQRAFPDVNSKPGSQRRKGIRMKQEGTASERRDGGTCQLWWKRVPADTSVLTDLEDLGRCISLGVCVNAASKITWDY